MTNNPQNFEDVKGRLDQIVEAVSDENIPLDDALKLYEEAVELGLFASSLLEENLAESNARYDEQGAEAAEEGSAEDPDGPESETEPKSETESVSESEQSEGSSDIHA